MLRDDYGNVWKNLNLSKDQIKKMETFIEDFCFNDAGFVRTHDNIEEDAIIDTFNDLSWFFSGEGDCKDIFSEEADNYIPITPSILFPKNSYDDTIENRTKAFSLYLKTHFNAEQLKLIKEAIKELFLVDKVYIDNKYYLKNKYQLIKLKTKQSIISKII